MNSTLVETVSINYEDFNESFLTCGTCLCMYDGSEHTPKLLPCSHTVCLHCLTRIAASQTRDTGTFRCPICRELITIPRGGVAALPPSFLVNQLLDLMSRQRRDVIPKCSTHNNQELLFCETCDTVFCTICTGGSHNPSLTTNVDSASTSNCEHTIIPFSIAIKRISEILLYKANQCISKLTEAQENVNSELQRLDCATQKCLASLDEAFNDISTLLERRKMELASAISVASETKRKVLDEQMFLIQAEKEKVEKECEGLQYQVEVRNITQRISSLSTKLDSVSALREPRENAFLSCDLASEATLQRLDAVLASVGRVRTTTTFPSLSTIQIKEKCSVNLEATAFISTVDYHGNTRSTGGDPIAVELLRADQSDVSCQLVPTNMEARVIDLEDGTYHVKFRPTAPGRYALKASVLDRQIRDSPLFIDVCPHNNPVRLYGCRGSGKDEFLQPVAAAIDSCTGMMYILDTGNSRIKVLSPDLRFICHLENEALSDRSCTGIAVSSYIGETSDKIDNIPWLAVVNWRSKMITRLNREGEVVASFSHPSFQEPTDLAIDPSYGHILVADNGPCCIFVFDTNGKLLFQVGKKGNQPGCFNLISSVTVGPGGEIIVADSRIQVFSAKGDFLQEIYAEGKGNGRYGGVAVDSDGIIVASRTEKTKHFIQVFKMSDGTLLNTIDSHDSRLKRPCGLATTCDKHVIVVDLGNDCIKKYRYW